MVADRIKLLREAQGLTQAELAKKLGITRSSVNAWEMGISVPSTQYLVELSTLFCVSADYLLGITKRASVSVAGLTDEEVAVITQLIHCLLKRKEEYL